LDIAEPTILALVLASVWACAASRRRALGFGLCLASGPATPLSFSITTAGVPK